jgi:hypothetical protein
MDVAALIVESTEPIEILHALGGRVRFYTRRHELWRSEGFTSQLEMDAWFRAVIPEGKSIQNYLMQFHLL